MEAVQRENRLRIIEMTYRAGESHLGSALSAVDIIEAIYQVKKEIERFVLSAGHSATALYAVLETHGLLKNPDLKKLQSHPERNIENRIDVSTGSLGQGLPIAVGMALADKSKKVYCCLSDGECMEGSIYESLRIITENSLANLITVVNANGFMAYREVNLKQLSEIFEGFGLQVIAVDGHNLKELIKTLNLEVIKPTIIIALTKVDHLPFLNGVSAHYYKMTQKDYQSALKKWSQD